jgi:ABC-type antimicrobial peptide transport system permease subunit
VRALADRAVADAHVEQAAIRGNNGRLDADEAARKRALRGKPDNPGSFDEMVGLYLAEDPSISADRNFRPQVFRWSVSDSYFRTMGLSLVQGRAFDAHDQAGSAPVAVVSEALTRAVWHRPDVVGRTFTAGRGGTPITVIGVARDYRSSYRDAAGLRIIPMPAVYFTERQVTPANVRLIARARGDVNALAKAIPALVHSVDAQAVVERIQTMAQEGGGETAMLSRIFGTILGVLAICALLLATIGTYGVISYGVTLRTREIGLRIALGGTQAQVVQLFVREGMRTISVGLAIGVAIALGASQVLRGILLGVSPFDPLSYFVTLAFFGSVALLACWLPSRKAARVEPMVALRGE